MKVTGWTYYDNPRFIDLRHDRMKEVLNIYEELPKVPNPDTCSKEEFNEKLKEYNKAYDDSFEKLYKERNLDKADILLDEMEQVVIEDIRNNGYHFCGDSHQNTNYGTPIIDDKYIYCTSQREWGGLIVEAFPEEFDKDDEYAYTKWAWTNEKEKMKTPDKSLWVE